MDLPANSNIIISTEKGIEQITIPHQSAGIMKYFIAAFLIFWLGCWVMGFASAFGQVIAGEGGAFIIFWLCGWTVGGIFALFFLRRLLSKSKPEIIKLSYPLLDFDSGIPPFKMHFGFQAPSQQWRQIFPKREQKQFQKRELTTLKLRETSKGNRLTIDSGNQRVEIASSATEIEKEWLYKILRAKYS